jgi:hypothetical protein
MGTPPNRFRWIGMDATELSMRSQTWAHSNSRSLLIPTYLCCGDNFTADQKHPYSRQTVSGFVSLRDTPSCLGFGLITLGRQPEKKHPFGLSIDGAIGAGWRGSTYCNLF